MNEYELAKVADFSKYLTIPVQDHAIALEVRSDADEERSGGMLVEIARVLKDIETDRKKTIEKPDKYVRWVNAEARHISDRFKSAKAILNEKVLAYHQEKAREVKAEAEVAESLGVEGYPMEVKTPVVHVDGGKISTQKHWTFELNNLCDVPITYHTLDTASVRVAIREGVRKIPGIHIFQEARLVANSS